MMRYLLSGVFRGANNQGHLGGLSGEIGNYDPNWCLELLAARNNQGELAGFSGRF